MTFLYIIIALVLIFDFINGFHDSANSIACVVSTRVLSPFAAVLMAAFFNFVAFLIFPLKVAHTMGSGVVEPDVINLNVTGAALVAATHWGIPVSTTHTITGAIMGAGARKGASAVKWGVTNKIFWAWILTIPVSGCIGGVMYPFLTG